MGAAKRSFTGWSACRLRGYPKVRTQPIYRFFTKVELVYPHEAPGGLLMRRREFLGLVGSAAA